MKCPRCNARVAAQARFCAACGQALATDQGKAAWAEAKRRFDQGDYAGAGEALKPLLFLRGPEGAKALAWQGHALFFRGREAEAAEQYRRALQLEPALWDAWFQLGSLAFSRGQHEEAVQDFERAAALQPDLGGSPLSGIFGGDPRRARAHAQLYLGLSLRSLGQEAPAEAALARSIELNPADPLPYGVLGGLLTQAGRFTEAAERYQAALGHVRDEQGLRSLRNDLGVALFQAGDLERAADAFKAVLKDHPDDANAVHNLGMLYLKRGLGEELRQDLREFLKADQADELLLGLTRSLVEGARGEGAAVPATGLLGSSPAMRDVNDLVSRAAASQANVLLLGPNGSGKELAARAIHRLSPRAKGPFIAVNCAALPETLLESELFGYEKGAFTGAHAAKRGRFELADAGTLFLDEIGDLQPSLQVKLLRAVQEKTFERLGGSQTLRSDFRLITATHQDLRKAVLEGRFREDLFYRLFVFPIQLPPLKDRLDDVPVLAEHFLSQAVLRSGKRFARVGSAARQRLMAHDWPGNVRELENLIERAVALHDGEQLEPEHLQFDALGSGPAAGAEPLGEGGLLAQAERQAISQALRAAAFKVPQAAKALGMSRATLYRKMEQHGIKSLRNEIKSQI
jgi:DNA-binding NtrC family response regulator/Flp pilus assembly protein TadD